MHRNLSFAVLLTMVVGFSVARAQTPKTLSFSGQLTEGSTLLDAVVPMTFKLYDDGGTWTEWTETHPSVSVVNGLFTVLLGGINPLPDSLFTGPLFVGIQVDDDPELSPRTALSGSACTMEPMYEVLTFKSINLNPSWYVATCPAGSLPIQSLIRFDEAYPSDFYADAYAHNLLRGSINCRDTQRLNLREWNWKCDSAPPSADIMLVCVREDAGILPVFD